MRIYFLSIIACFLLVSIAVSSCIDSEETYVASSDATVHAFGLDTVHGKSYKFAIDQINGRIFNPEPLPVGADTILDSILIDTFHVTGYVTSGLTTDTILNISNHQDLRGAINLVGEKRSEEKNLIFKVCAADMTTKREYKLSIRVYEHNPDSMRWNAMGNVGLPETSLADHQRLITLDSKQALLLYTLDENNQLVLYQNSTKEYGSWALKSLNGIQLNHLPQIVKMHTLSAPNAQAQDILYTVANNQVHQSTDGQNWSAMNALSTPVGYNLEQLICGFSHSLIGVVSQNGKSYLVQTNDELTAWKSEMTELPEGFPTRDIYTADYQTSNLLNQIILVGRTDYSAKKIIPWAFDGKNWSSMNPTTEFDSYCLTEKVGFNPTILHYNEQFYLFGETLNFIYSSITRLAWYEADKKFFLPKEIERRGNYTTALDQDQYIWIITSKGKQANPNNNEVWRGRLNKFGFEY